MALAIEEIKKLILEAIPDASIEIKDLMGDNNHYSAIIKSKIFKGLNKDPNHYEKSFKRRGVFFYVIVHFKPW